MSRERILARVRGALEGREKVEHPGSLSELLSRGGAPPPGADGVDAVVNRFIRRFEEAGGEVARVARGQAAAWVDSALVEHGGCAWGCGARTWLAEAAESGAARDPSPAGGTRPSRRSGLPLEEGRAAPDHAAGVGVSLAWAAVAETGSLLLASDDGRRVQLLPPVHLVILERRRVIDTLERALTALAAEGLPSAVGVHSGPSKSADIGHILVRGVHGPGRVITVLVD